jgi:hypothetical protein
MVFDRTNAYIKHWRYVSFTHMADLIIEHMNESNVF